MNLIASNINKCESLSTPGIYNNIVFKIDAENDFLFYLSFD